MMMIPGQWEGRPRPLPSTAAELRLTPPSAPPPVIARHDEGPPPDLGGRERPGWVKAAIFAAILLAASWLVMWLAAASR
jgi:hypothetical protein